MIKLDLYLFSVGITTVIQQITLDQHPVLIGYRWLKPDITDSVVPDSINPHTIQIKLRFGGRSLSLDGCTFSVGNPSFLPAACHALLFPVQYMHTPAYHSQLPYFPSESLFPDIAAADLPFSVHLFSITKSSYPYTSAYSASIFASPRLSCPKWNPFRSQYTGHEFFNQDLPDEILCRHTCDIFGKRAFQQYIYFPSRRHLRSSLDMIPSLDFPSFS